MTERFSGRHGYGDPDVEITVREDAPVGLRVVIEKYGFNSGLRGAQFLELVCDVLCIHRDPSKGILDQLRDHLSKCEWFYVYDVIEEMYSVLQRQHEGDPESFAQDINTYFRRNGIGWQLVDGQIKVRGDEHFQAMVDGAMELLGQTEHEKAREELGEAIRDLSRRPRADVTGAIQRSMTALECVARHVTGDANSTLGKIVKDNKGNPDFLPRPLDEAIDKIWGYASDRARHLREGDPPPAYEEAEIVVAIAGAVCVYLVKKKSRQLE